MRTPPPRDDLRFSNTTDILQKKKLCGLLVLKYSKRRMHPLLRKILDPPQVNSLNFRRLLRVVFTPSVTQGVRTTRSNRMKP